MKKIYSIYLDVTMAGYLDVEAESAEEAETIAKETKFVPSDLRHFNHIATDVVEVEENDD